MKQLIFIFLLSSTVLLHGQTNCNLIDTVTLHITPQDSITPVLKVAFHSVWATDSGFASSSQQWQYIAITLDNNQYAKYYRNGQLITQGPIPSHNYYWNRIDIGVIYYTSYLDWYNGSIDEIRLSNIARTSSEIANAYSSNTEFSNDSHTIGLWHFNQSSGNTINAAKGPNGTRVGAVWNSQGKFGNCLSFNGINQRAVLPKNVPTSNMTFEFWIKTNSAQNAWVVSWYGMYTSGVKLNSISTTPQNYIWSTGDTSNSITVNPNQIPYVWVTDGTCTDTVYFDSQSAITHDTVLISVTDTLIIDAKLTGVNPPNNINRIKVYPNPASTHIYIDNGNFLLMNGYSIEIINSSSQTVFSSLINQQQFYIDISSWTGNGLYFMKIKDPTGNIIEVKKLIIK